ncbi:L-rhamnose-1-dehydrogenase [[Candida] anglica]|uniref:L-rhamnose-1-dehydrogenase n=1 Tax=[Candida] anglica TaxID=148631 RepID=A0ABP0E8T7_9ASCO
MSNLFDLTGKVALVTGGNRGIGLALGEGLVEAGAHLIIIHRPETDSKASIEELKLKTINSAKILSMPFDLKTVTEENVSELVIKILELSPTNRIDILVNNAAIAKAILANDLSMKDYDEIMTVNLKAPLLLSQHVGKHMMERYKIDNSYRGKIINISSIMAYTAMTHSTAYTIAKTGLHNMTKSLSNEWAKHGINVNVIAPGPTDTEMVAAIKRQGDENPRSSIVNRIPMGRRATPDDYKGTVIYLSSRASDFVTGEVVIVDGGFMG